MTEESEPDLTSAVRDTGLEVSEENADKLNRLIDTMLNEKFDSLKKEVYEQIENTVIDKLEQTKAEFLKTENPVNRDIVRTTETNISTNGKNEDLQIWRMKAEEELKNAKQTDVKNLSAYHTVLCIDTSESMQTHNAWEQTMQFVQEYLRGLKDEHLRGRKCYTTAIVTFGKETKVQQRLTQDIEALQQVIENLTVGGPKLLTAGLIFSKAAVTSSNFTFTKVNNMTTAPRIIVITDGRVSGFETDKEDHQNRTEDRYSAKDEVAAIRKDDFEIHFVYVGRPDIVFLHCLCEISQGELLPFTSGLKIAKFLLFKFILHEDEILTKYEGKGDEDDITTTHDDSEGRKMTVDDFFETIFSKAFDFTMRQLGRQKNAEELARHMYNENQEMQNYAPIGTRVKRGTDWIWGDQDKGGPGTVIGHFHDNIQKFWCWVEWDYSGDRNVYRWNKNGKCDLTSVDDERKPQEGHIIAVGSKVKPGDGYNGKSTHNLGIAIKLLDGKKVQVRWEDDGAREELTFGKDGTSKQVVPVVKGVPSKKEIEMTHSSADDNLIIAKDLDGTDSSLPAPPDCLEVFDIFETSATLSWEHSIDEKKSLNSKYVVTYKETNNSRKKTELDVDAADSCTLNDLKPGFEYSVDVRMVNEFGESSPTQRRLFKTMKTDTDDSHYAGWKLTEREAARLTSAIGENWEMLGPDLGIGQIPLHRIKQDNQTSTLCIYHMLSRWVRQDANPTFAKFMKILRNNSEVSVEQSIINSMKEEFRLVEIEANKSP